MFLWLNTEPERLGDQLALIEDERNELAVSAASSWEIALKYGLERVPLPEPPERYVPERIRAIGAVALPIEHHDALAAADLPPIHRDPFDRLLVSQALSLGISLVTADPVIERYAAETILVGT